MGLYFSSMKCGIKPFSVDFAYGRYSSVALLHSPTEEQQCDNVTTLQIHWLSIINSMVLVFLLIAFVVVILVCSLVLIFSVRC